MTRFLDDSAKLSLAAKAKAGDIRAAECNAQRQHRGADRARAASDAELRMMPIPQMETGIEGVVIAVLLRLLFRFDIDLTFTILAGVGSRVATAYFGPSFVPPDWWIAEIVIASSVTLAILGSIQLVRAT